jgi:DNA-binding NarL/FixJ family response regulator
MSAGTRRDATKRERAVELFNRGLAVEQIAERLGTTRASVDNMLYKARLMRREKGTRRTDCQAVLT